MHTDKTWVKRVRPGYEQVLAPYPNIRIIGPSAVALLMDGSVIRAADLEDQLPLLILNKSECTKKGIEALLNSGFYRRKFCNIDSFNHSVEADIHTRALGKKAAQIHWEQEYFNVFSGSDKDYYYEFNAYKRKKDKAASLGRLYDSCLALVDWDDMLKSTRHILGPLSQESSATAAAKEQKFLAALKGLQKTLSLISPDTLEAANLHGIDIMAAPLIPIPAPISKMVSLLYR